MNAALEPAFEGVAHEHVSLNEDLEKWGRWNREGRRKRACGSIEHEHISTGYRSYNEVDGVDLQISLPPDPRNLAVDRAVLEVPGGHQLALKLHYVQLAPGWLVARRCAIPKRDLGRWMHDARCMVANLLRRHGA